MKKLSNEQNKELSRLKEIAIFILEFLETQSDSKDEVFQKFKSVIEATFSSSDLKGMKMIKNDIVQWAKGLDPANRAQLNGLLQNQFLESLYTPLHLDKLLKIIRRGRLRSESEYKIAYEYYEGRISNTENAKDIDTEKLIELLTNYQQRTGKF